MLYLFLTFFIFISEQLWAKNCNVTKLSSNGYFDTTIPEDDSFSYFNPQGPLANFKIQDQDGLGTCYANSLTAALKVSHKDHPNLSYLHAALIGSQEIYESKSQQLIDSENQLYFNGGNSCRTLKKMQEHGGACPANESFLENTPLQRSLLKALGKYLDYFKTDAPIKKEAFKRQFNLMIKKSTEAIEVLSSKCLDDKKKGFAPSENFDNILRLIATQYQSYNQDCSKIIKAHIRSMYTKDSIFREDRIYGELSEETLNQLRAFSKDQLIPYFRDFEKTLKSESDKKYASLSMPFFKKLEDFIKKGITDFNCAKESILPKNEEQKKLFFIEMSDQWNTFNKKDCLKPNQLDILNFIQERDLSDAPFECLPDELSSKSKDLFLLYPHLKKLLGDDFLEKLNPDTVKDSLASLQKIIMPNCQKKENLVDLKKFQCSLFRPANFEKSKCEQGKGCKSVIDEEKVKQLYQADVLNHLEKGQGIIVNVCSDFLKIPNSPKTNFCKDNIENAISKGHAMNITGYKCINGKLKYEILNSWGSNCPDAAISDTTKTIFECHLDKSGKTTGRFWVDEDVLMDNTAELEFIE